VTSLNSNEEKVLSGLQVGRGESCVRQLAELHDTADCAGQCKHQTTPESNLPATLLDRQEDSRATLKQPRLTSRTPGARTWSQHSVRIRRTMLLAGPPSVRTHLAQRHCEMFLAFSSSGICAMPLPQPSAALSSPCVTVNWRAMLIREK
jgi:hypothetical protein